MNMQTQTSKANDGKKIADNYQKAAVQNEKASPNESAPAFTKIEPAQGPVSPLLQAAKGNDELMSQPPQSETAPKTRAEPIVEKPIPKETAQEVVHQVMPKTEAKKIEAEVAASAPIEKATAKDQAKKVQL